MGRLRRSFSLVVLDNVVFCFIALLAFCTVCLHYLSPHNIDTFALKCYRIVLLITLAFALCDLVLSIRWLFTFVFPQALSEIKYLAMITTDNNSVGVVNNKAPFASNIDHNDKLVNTSGGTPNKTSPSKSRIPVKSQTSMTSHINSSKSFISTSNTYGMKKPLVLDIGSINCRYGYAGSKKPSKTFKTQNKINCFTDISSSNILSNEKIVNWSEMEKVWNYIFDEEKRSNYVNRTNHDNENNLLDNLVSSSLEDQPLFLSWCPSFSSYDAETVAEIAFEKYNVPSLYLGINSVLSLYGCGKLTGCSFHSGDSISHSCCIQDGYAIPETLTLSTRSGNTVTKYLNQSLLKYGISKDKVQGNMIDFIRLVKEKVCLCKNGKSENNNNSSSGSSGVPLTLPDGTNVSISEQDTKYCAEKLFQSFGVKISARLGQDSNSDLDPKYNAARDEYDISIQQTIIDSIERCPEEYRAGQWKNISLSGGNSLLNGLRERVQNELIASAADDVKINVSGISSRDQTIWLGGSVLASNDDFMGHWISRDEYNANGIATIHQKCQTKLIRKHI